MPHIKQKTFPLLSLLQPQPCSMIRGLLRLYHQRLRRTISSIASCPPALPTSTVAPINKHFNRSNQTSSIDDFIPLVQSLLKRGAPDEAESVWEGLRIRFPQALPQRLTLSLANLFITSWLAKGTGGNGRNERKAREWYVKMTQEYFLSPNEQTFCLFLDYCAKEGKLEDFRVFLQEFLRCSSKFLSLEMLIQQGFIQEREAVSNCLAQLNSACGKDQVEKISTEKEFVRKFWELFPTEQQNESSVQVSASSLPVISEQKSKSGGIVYVKQSLQSLNETLLAGTDFYSLQEALERDSLNATIERLTASRLEFLQMADSYNLSSIRVVFSNWVMALVGEIPRAIAELPVDRQMQKQNLSVHELLKNLPPEKLAIICLLEVFRVQKKASEQSKTEPFCKFVSLASAIGTAIEREVLASSLPASPYRQQLTRKIMRFLPRDRVLKEPQVRETIGEVVGKLDEFSKLSHPVDWTPVLRVEVGAFLLQLCLQLCKFQREGQEYSALEHKIIKTPNGERLGVIQVHPFIMEEVSKEPVFVHATPSSLPMLIPPVPWFTCDSGGYLSYRNLCVRLRGDATQRAMLKSYEQNKGLQRILLGLDILGGTGWKINQPVLQVMIQAWNEGMQIGALPPKLDASALLQQAQNPRERYQAQNTIQANHSQRCDLNYKLEIAKSFAGKTFYFPHNIDFRGRAYPIPPHFNHIGSDVCRGLLKFHEKRPLGPRGFFWLQVHLANVYGNSKCTLDERVQFTQQSMEAIHECVRNPLQPTNTGFWWTKADDPWQCLATCREIVAALQWKEGIEAFPSDLPIHQDGSCNGPQHYAALGRDALGAAKVNLLPSSTPQDIYATVATIVEEELQRDIEGECAETREIALLLRGKITRKIVKQPVMTNVYGVTNYGAQRQIRERLKEFGIVPVADYAKAANYISKKVFHALDKLFSTARQLQNWLAFCAKEIALSVESGVQAEQIQQRLALQATAPLAVQEHNSEVPPYPGTLVAWTSPIGFPAVQPYRKKWIKNIRTAIQTVNVMVPSEQAPVDVGKQIAGFPPNFIHSLDASHMFRTAIACNEVGITFASVHDSYWTHASSVDEMGKILRKEFVALHSESVMQKLREEFIARYGTNRVPVIQNGSVVEMRPINIPPLPESGTFEIESVLESVYFFS